MNDQEKTQWKAEYEAGKLCNVGELANELRVSRDYVTHMKKWRFQMPGGRAYPSEARYWLRLNPEFRSGKERPGTPGDFARNARETTDDSPEWKDGSAKRQFYCLGMAFLGFFLAAFIAVESDSLTELILESVCAAGGLTLAGQHLAYLVIGETKGRK